MQVCYRDGICTHDSLINRQVLFYLSYSVELFYNSCPHVYGTRGTSLVAEMGFQPMTSGVSPQYSILAVRMTDYQFRSFRFLSYSAGSMFKAHGNQAYTFTIYPRDYLQIIRRAY